MGLKNWIATKILTGKLPMWVYRLIGKQLAKKLNLTEENNMAATETKPWYRSKTIWAAIITAIIGAIQPVSASMGHPMSVPLWIIEVLIGFGLYGLRTSTTDIAPIEKS